MESNRQVAIHMNHKDEPRKIYSRQPSPSGKGEGRRVETRINRRGSWQWTGGVLLAHLPAATFPSAASVGDMLGSDARVSGETCHGEQRRLNRRRNPIKRGGRTGCDRSRRRS